MKKLPIILSLAASLLLSGCDEFKDVRYTQDYSEPAVTYVSFTEPSVELVAEDSPTEIEYKIGGVGDYSKDVNITSTNEEVATCASLAKDDKYYVAITPLKEGTTTVKITSKENEKAAASLEVKVNAKPAIPDKITLTIKSLSMSKDESQYVYVEETNGNVSWSVDYNLDIVELSEQSNEKVKVTAKMDGYVTVRATVGKASATCNVVVSTEPSYGVMSLNFTNSLNWNEVHLYSKESKDDNYTYEDELTSYSINDFGQKVYSFSIDGDTYKSIAFGKTMGKVDTVEIQLSDFGTNNAVTPITPVGEALCEVEFSNYVKKDPTVSFVGENVSIWAGNTKDIKVLSTLGDVEYSLTSGESYVELSNESNTGVSVLGKAVGTAVIKAKIVGTDIYDEITVDVVAKPNAIFDNNSMTSYEVSKNATINVYGVAKFDDANETPCDITWSITSGSDVITLVKQISTGVTVKGIKVGEAKIVANYDGKTSDEITISVHAAAEKTFYFTNGMGWGNVYLYAWAEGNVKNAEYPGVKLNNYETNNYGQQVFTFAVEDGMYDGMLFNNGEGQQTVDVHFTDFVGENDNVYTTELNNEGKLNVGFAKFTPADPTIEVTSDNVSVAEGKQTSVGVTTTNGTPIYSIKSGSEYVSIDASSSNSSLVINGLAKGSAVVTITVKSVTKDINVTVTDPIPENKHDFYFALKEYTWSDFRLYLFGPGNVTNGDFPGEALNGEKLTAKTFGDCYKVTIDLNVYSYCILSAVCPTGRRQSTDILLQDVLDSNADLIILDNVSYINVPTADGNKKVDTAFEKFESVTPELSFGSYEATLMVGKKVSIEVTTNVNVTYEFVSGSDNATIESSSNNTQLVIKGVKAGQIQVAAKYLGETLGSVTLEIVEYTSDNKTFYFENYNKKWTNFSIYLFGNGEENASFPGEEFKSTPTRDAHNKDTYALTIDMNKYTKFILSGKEDGVLKQTRDISFSEFGTNNEAIYDNGLTWIDGKCDVGFETYNAYSGPSTYKLYLDVSTNWKDANATFFVHAYDKVTLESKDYKFTLVTGNIYVAEIKVDYTGLVFVRMPNGSSTLNWDTKWNQTGDETYDGSKNLYTINDWSSGTWSTYSA